MERYKHISTPRSDPPFPVKENEIRVTSQGLTRNYISYATSLFQDHNASEVVLMAMGRAINNAVMVSEVLKKRIQGLHQNITLSSSDVTDVWEPLEEGLETLELVRHVSTITITLSVEPLDISSSGYQPPASLKQGHPLAVLNGEEGGSKGAGGSYSRGQGFQRRNARFDNGVNIGGDENWNPGRGGYRGRARGYNVGGRGGYNKGYSQPDTRELSSQNRGFNKSYPQAETRGKNNFYPPFRTRGYNNGYYQQTNARGYNGNYTEVNTRGYNQPQTDAKRYNNSQRNPRQYNSEYSQPVTGNHDNAAFRGRGRSAAGSRGGGRGRGRLGP